MTSHAYVPSAFLGQKSGRLPAGIGLKVLPSPHSERLRRSFENLCSLDSDSTSGDSELTSNCGGGGGEGFKVGMADPDDAPLPDYGDGVEAAPLTDYGDGAEAYPLRPISSSYSSSDLSSHPNLNEETVLEVVKRRYQEDLIFTRCGDILISVNPFKQLKIFDVKEHEKYCIDSLSSKTEPEPHLFWVAAEALACRSRENTNQVVLVSGESGAGKTEAVKLMLSHILHLTTSKQKLLYESIDKVNPLIELFGNARTQLNGNSSRFAKFLEVQFSKDDSFTGTVTGATIRDYILEKSRVTTPSEGESNFHIFYTYLEDVMRSPDKRKMFLMDGMDLHKDFRIVPPSSWHQADNRMNIQEQSRVFKYIGVPEEDVENMHLILAAILHLTNIRFQEDDGSTAAVKVENEESLRKAAALLCLDEEKLLRVLVTRKAVFSGTEIEMFQSLAKAEETRDAVGKALYERLFGWLIRTINIALSRHSSTEAGIWFLDICGFEDLRHNSLEQLCINLANEHLQRFLNEHIFQHEVRQYQSQGIQLDDVHPPSNDAILDMFNEPKTGVLALVNEDTRLEISSNASLVQKLCRNHGRSSSYMRYKNDDPRFGIQHFAGPVWYDAHHFLEKNADYLNKEVKDVLVASSNELVSDIFQVEKSSTGSIAPTNFNYRRSTKRAVHLPHGGQTRLSDSVVRGLRESLRHRFGDQIPSMEDRARSKISDQRTVIDCFKESMKELLHKMDSAHALFVRCIKPNDRQLPDVFQDKKVCVQLKYNGITEIARIRKIWFPVRQTLEDFLTKYCFLSEEAKKERDKRKAVMLLLDHVQATSDQYRVGKSMVFLKEQVAGYLEKARDKEKRRLQERKKKEAEERKKKEAEERKKQAEEKKEEEERKRKEEEERKKKEAEERKKKEDAAKHQKPTQLETVVEVSTPSTSTTSFLLSSESSEEDEDEEEEEAQQEEEDTEVQQEHNEEADTTNKFWDIFRIVAREKERTDIHHLTTMKILKVIAYVLILLLVLVSSTAQRTSLMLVIGNMGADKTDKEKPMAMAFQILMIVAVCIPYVLTFLISVLKVCFGSYRNPSLGTWIWVFITETVYSLGLSVLVFRILPSVQSVLHGLLILSAVGIIPSILKLVTSVDVRISSLISSRSRLLSRVTSRCLDLLALGGQASIYFAVFLSPIYVSTDKDRPERKHIWSVLDIISVTLVGVGCWENFMDGRFVIDLNRQNPLRNFLLKRRFDLKRGRYIPLLLTSVWKIFVTCLLAYFIRKEDSQQDDYQKGFKELASFYNQWKHITPIIVLTLSALVCYYFSYIACKLWMQRLAFAVPLTLSTPCAILIFYLDSKYSFLRAFKVFGDEIEAYTWPKGNTDNFRHWIYGAAWFISLLILTRHVWWPRQNRLEKFEMLFMNPLYCGILTMETLFLNRRRHTLSCRKKRIGVDDNVWIYSMDKSENCSKNNPDYVDGTYAVIGDSAGSLENAMGESYRRRQGDEEIPMIYACATMWHEVRREMVALLKSLHRIDLEQWTRRQAQDMSGAKDKDYFEYEAHIFFDDAMTLDDDEEYIPNDYVKMLVAVMEEAVSSVYKKTMRLDPPIKIATPYGGQLLWIMPGGNLLFVHLKDKTKIRHRKRWSQVMYMYYLLGFRLTRQCQNQILEALRAGMSDEHAQWNMNRDNVVGSDIFEMLDEKVAIKSQNTFVMALDGDTDFSPGSVHILLDRMKKNPKVGAACGRIHPIGSGPMVWYQMFEYAIGHWMQKATEHVLGCVLCSPGCFSLFRGSALMDDNVMRKYTILPTEPGHFLQYDQGEDRWLCTLLLQQGYRVDYAAAADAWTYCPEGFNEFFNQRRRWMPSTLANVMDLLSDFSNTVAVNSNISMLYIIYQVALMFATIVGPGTVLLMIAGAIEEVLELPLYWSYVISLIPAIGYLLVCMYCKANIQLYLAALLSTIYAFVMLLVFVGVIRIAVMDSIWHPSVIVILLLILIFIAAGLCHPMELYCLPSGILYLLCVPSGYLLLVIYSLCNLHVVSWGTREAPKKKTKAEQEQDRLEAEEKKKKELEKKGFFSRILFSSYLSELKEVIQSTGLGQRKEHIQQDRAVEILEQMNQTLQMLAAQKAGKGAGTSSSSPDSVDEDETLVNVVVDSGETAKSGSSIKAKQKKQKKVQIKAPEPEKVVRDQLVNPKWIEDKGLGSGDVMQLFDEEMDFWKTFIHKYLAPLDADKEKEKEMMSKLLELRTQVIFAFSMINLLWIAINFFFQFKTVAPVKFRFAGKDTEQGMLGLLFIFFLLAILLLQIIGMIAHRWGTLLHLLAFTDIRFPCFSRKLGSMANQDEDKFQRAFEFCQKIIDEPIPDYLENDGIPTATSVRENLEDRLRKSIRGGTHGLGRQSVMASLNQSGVVPTDFMNSRHVSLYLRGTRVRRDEEDVEAANFLSKFRSNMLERPRQIANGRPASGTDPGLANGDALHRTTTLYQRRPKLPPRATTRRTVVRAEIVRDTIKRIQETSRFDAGMGGASRLRVAGADGLEGLPPQAGRMDRALSRRLHRFSEYSRGHVRNDDSDDDNDITEVKTIAGRE